MKSFSLNSSTKCVGCADYRLRFRGHKQSLKGEHFPRCVRSEDPKVLCFFMKLMNWAWLSKSTTRAWSLYKRSCLGAFSRQVFLWMAQGFTYILWAASLSDGWTVCELVSDVHAKWRRVCVCDLGNTCPIFFLRWFYCKQLRRISLFVWLWLLWARNPFGSPISGCVLAFCICKLLK